MTIQDPLLARALGPGSDDILFADFLHEAVFGQHRQAGETADGKTRKVTLKDLESGDVANDKGATTTVVVMRPTAKQEYTVPVEATDTAVAEAKRKQPGL